MVLPADLADFVERFLSDFAFEAGCTIIFDFDSKGREKTAEKTHGRSFEGKDGVRWHK